MANLLVAYRYSPYTTANYMVSVFERLGHSVNVTDGSGGDIAARLKADARIWIEAGGGPPSFDWLDVLGDQSVPTAAWFIDSHTQGNWHYNAMYDFDYAFFAQKQAINEAAWMRGATWLPVACDPKVHMPPRDIEPVTEVVFVGHLYGEHPWYERRRDLLDKLARRYDLGVYENVYHQDMAQAHANGKVVFNVSTMGDLNMRVFEAMCSGRPLVTDAVPGAGLDKLFIPGVHYLPYSTEQELYENIDYLLGDPEARQNIANNALMAVTSKHTYEHRAKQMLEVMGV